AKAAAAKAAAARAAAARFAADRAARASAPEAVASASSGSSNFLPPPAAPVSSGWTPGKGQAAVAAAERWLGTPYAWAGGTPAGPSYGMPPDVGVLGFDCSGLVLYSWSQEGIGLPHFSGYQYASGPHPSTGALLPGDLLFWSYDGTPATIHHVAIYIGHGDVIEAPQSGDVVKIVPIWYDGLVGATRPDA
ncbi:MAG: C40 family peptidase, partial [Mycobacteriales bacterium]